MTQPTRRTFLTGGTSVVGATGLVSALESSPSNFEVEDQQPFRGQTRRLKISNHSRKVASLIFSTDYPTHFRLKPELYPVLTPKGFPVTDSHQYCFIHHQSIMCGHGRVRTEDGRVIDFYRKLGYPENERADRWHSEDRNLFQLGPSGMQRIVEANWTDGEQLAIDLRLLWQTRAVNTEVGETILEERRRYEISQEGSSTIIDHWSHLVPASGPIVLEADRHSFCGVRVNDLIDVEDGGTMRDSEGRINPDGNYWDSKGERRAPSWVDCTGCIGDARVGVTLIAHPGNLRNQFYVRDWGLMEVSPMLGEDVSFSRENPFQFGARYVAHDGELDVEHTNALLAAFAEKGFPVK